MVTLSWKIGLHLFFNLYNRMFNQFWTMTINIYYFLIIHFLMFLILIKCGEVFFFGIFRNHFHELLGIYLFMQKNAINTSLFGTSGLDITFFYSPNFGRVDTFKLKNKSINWNQGTSHRRGKEVNNFYFTKLQKNLHTFPTLCFLVFRTHFIRRYSHFFLLSIFSCFWNAFINIQMKGTSCRDASSRTSRKI